MTIHTWIKNWQCWLLGADFKPQRRMDELLGSCVEWKELDIVRFTGNLAISAEAYADIDRTVDQFLLFIRHDDDWDEGGWSGMQVCAIEAQNPKWQPIDGKRTMTCDMAGQGGAAYFLSRFICQPDPSGDGTAIYLQGKADDVIKDLIRYSAVVGTAYDDPDGNPRGLAGLSVAADKTEHPDTVERYFRGNLWEQVKLLCLDHDIDLTFTPSWNGPDGAVTFEVDTHYQGRGADKTPGNPDPAVLSNEYQVFTSSDSHFNKLPHKTHLYTGDGKNVLATNDHASRLRAEILVDTLIEARLSEAAVDHRAEEGHNAGFRETKGLQVGRDIWIGDTIPSFDSVLGTRVVEKRIAGVKITILRDVVGSEQIELLVGDDKRKSGGGQSKPQEETLDGGDGSAASRFISGDADTPVGPDAESVIQIYSDTPGTELTEDPDNNRIALTAPWTEYDWGSGDMALRPTTNGNDVNILTSGGTLVTRLQADGKAWFDDDTVIGKTITGANVTTALAKLYIYDAVRSFAGMAVDNGSGQGEFSIVGGDSDILTMRNWTENGSLSFQVNPSFELAHGHGDGSTWSFRNGIDVIGYETADTSSVMWWLDGSNGNLFLDEDGTTTFGAYVLTWPKTGADTGDVLTASSVSGSAITLGWEEAASFTDWVRYAYGSIDTAIRPKVDNDSIHTRESVTSAVSFRVEGESGKGWLLSDLVVGAVETTPADPSTLYEHVAKLVVIDQIRNGAWTEYLHAGGIARMGVDSSYRAFINTGDAYGISFQTNSTQRAVVKDDGSEWAFEQSMLVAGYVATYSGDAMWSLDCSTGDFFLDEDGTTTLGGYTYTWPKSGAAEDDVLSAASVSGTAVTLDWVPPSLASMGNGTAQYQVPMTGADPFTPAWTALSANPGANIAPLRTDASGYLQLERLVVSSGNYVESAASNQISLIGSTYVSLRAGGGEIVATSAALYPYSGTPTLGISGKEWGDIRTDGDVYIGTAGKGIIMSSNTDGKALVANGSRYVPATLVITGYTDYFTPAGNSPVRDASGNALYWDSSTGLVNNTGTGSLMQIATTQHRHVMSAGNAPITYT